MPEKTPKKKPARKKPAPADVKTVCEKLHQMLTMRMPEPVELAMLAATLDPKLCRKDPREALFNALKLYSHAGVARTQVLMVSEALTRAVAENPDITKEGLADALRKTYSQQAAAMRKSHTIFDFMDLPTTKNKPKRKK